MKLQEGELNQYSILKAFMLPTPIYATAWKILVGSVCLKINQVAWKPNLREFDTHR